jgi:hypothetical protein
VETTGPTGYADCLSASWLAARLGVEPRRLDAMRRAGELIGVRPAGSTEWLYPGWQLSRTGVRDSVPQLVRAARSAGLDEDGLYEALTARRGLGGGERRLADLLVAGEDDRVLEAVRGRA